jgi:hypothetical protein
MTITQINLKLREVNALRVQKILLTGHKQIDIFMRDSLLDEEDDS